LCQCRAVQREEGRRDELHGTVAATATALAQHDSGQTRLQSSAVNCPRVRSTAAVAHSTQLDLTRSRCDASDTTSIRIGGAYDDEAKVASGCSGVQSVTAAEGSSGVCVCVIRGSPACPLARELIRYADCTV